MEKKDNKEKELEKTIKEYGRVGKEILDIINKSKENKGENEIDER